jgi:hypothetical protein
MVAQYGRDARRHLPSRSVCRRQIDVPTTFLGAREPHVTAKWRHRIRARCASPQKATCVHAARGRGRSRGPWRARDATHVRTHAVGGGGRQRRCASPPVGGQPSRQRGTRSAPETGRKAGRKPSRQTRSFFFCLVRTSFAPARHGLPHRKQPQAVIQSNALHTPFLLNLKTRMPC